MTNYLKMAMIKDPMKVYLLQKKCSFFHDKEHFNIVMNNDGMTKFYNFMKFLE